VEEIGKILPAVLRTHLRGESAPLLELLVPLWPRIAGKEISSQAEPVAFEHGTLTLGTDCPTWSLQLGRMSDELRAEINCYFGCPVVKKVRVRCRRNSPWSVVRRP